MYFSGWSEYTRQGNNIELWKWEFIFSGKSLGNNYKISHESFDITSIGIGDIYINTNDTRKFSLFSFDGIFVANLKDEGELMTSAHLYPHMYLKFNTRRAKFLKNADLVRISSVFTLDSLAEPLLKENISILAWKLDIENNIFLDAYVWLLASELDNTRKIFTDILSIGTLEFPGASYLKQYFSILLNDSKKKAYYKNTAFHNLVKLMKSKQLEPALVEEIISDLELLSEYPEDKQDVVEIINHYYRVSIWASNFSDIYAKINLYSLIFAIDNRKLPDNYQSYLSLNSLYQNFNIYGNYSYVNLLSFWNDYTSSSWVLSKDLTLASKQDLDYVSFFLSELFISKFSSSDENLREFWWENNLEHILQVMEDYIKLNNVIYDSTWDRRNVTGVYVHLDVLENLQDFMRNGLFRTDRWINGVLVKSKKFQLNSKEISLLDKNVNQLLDFYENNKQFISNQNQQEASLINQYNSLTSQFKEYFLALSDYESYIYNYDETKKSLFWIQTLWEKWEEILFSKESVQKYLGQFSSSSVSDMKILLKDNYYEISNFMVDGKNFAFSLYPFNANKIDNITINNKKVSVSYKLDSVQLDWSERLKSVSDEEQRNKYDFSQFFKNTFSSTSSQQPVDIFEIQDNSSASQDKFIVVFKRDKLLGTNWEFAGIKSFLDIEFNDIDLIAKNWWYDIFIDNAEISLRWKNSDFQATFASDYVLDKDKHYFKNIRLYPYESNIGVRKDHLGDNFIQIVGNVDLVDLKEVILALEENTGNLRYLYTAISKDLKIDDVSIRYIKSSKKLNFRFDYNGDFISILLSGDTIWNVSQAWKVIVRDVNYRTINDILTTIKK